MGRATARRRTVRLDLAKEPGAGREVVRPDTLVVEEPLEVRVGGRPFYVTMRTPGDDVDLAHGFLVGEGVVWQAGQVLGARYCAGAVVDEDGGGAVNTYNVLDLDLAPGVVLPEAQLERGFYTTSSCGVCGKASLDAVRTATHFDVSGDPLVVDARALAEMPDALREAQRTFDRTGGLHAAALFTPDGDMLVLREDVGRHNAVDKVVGWALREGRLPLAGHVLLVSGRASFELTQKAWAAGVPLLAAVSAPSSLAADLAEEAGMTLVGFLRGDTMNVYAHDRRVAGARAAATTG